MAALLSGGCGKAKDEPTFAEVGGVVTVDGVPATAGNIFFLPDEAKGTKGPASTGIINAKGEYTMTSSGERAGAIVGTHKVQIVCPSAGSSVGTTGTPPPPCNVPKKYEMADTSGLTADIKAGEKNKVDFNLTSK